MNGWETVLRDVVSPVVAAGGMLGVAKITSRGSEKSAKATAKAQDRASAVDGYHQLVTDLRTDMDRLRKDHDELGVEVKRLRESQTELRRQAVKDKSMIRNLIVYARRLRDELSRHQIRVPEPPGALDLDDPEFTSF